MKDLTFLTKEQILGKDKLDILKLYGPKCAATDFAILLGAEVSSNNYTSEGTSRKNRAGSWWTSSFDDEDNAYYISAAGHSYKFYLKLRAIGARPTIPYSLISQKASDKTRGKNGILEVEYGEYPQDVVSEDLEKVLETAYKNKTINQTDKNYTTNSVSTLAKDTPFQPTIHIEYEYNGRKFIRFIGKINYSGKILSNGRMVKDGDIYWLEVKPINWLIDEKTNIALSKKVVFSGIEFNREKNYKNNFNRTSISKFMNKIFSKDIIPSYPKIKHQQENKPHLNEKLTEIETLIDEINKYIQYAKNKEEIKEKINLLIKKYNTDLEDLLQKQLELQYKPTMINKDTLYNNLFQELINILAEVKQNYLNYQVEIEILDIINKAMDIITNGNKNNIGDNELLKDLTKIKTLILPNFIEEEPKLENELLDIINESKTEIEECIEKEKNSKYKNINEWELEFREKLQLILIKIQKSIIKKEYLSPIKKDINKTIENLHQESQNNLIITYMKEINDISKVIKTKTKEEKYLQQLQSIISFDINYSDTLEEILNDLKKRLIKLYRLTLDIEEYNNKILEIKNSKIDENIINNRRK